MSTGSDESDVTTVAPEDAFSVLGNETRMGILQTLGEADESLSFSELRNRVGVRDSGQFNYHLDKLSGHFVRKSGDEYALREPGSRIVQAVISGTVTDSTIMEPTELDAPCPYCGESIEISFQEERLVISCANCPGSYEGTETDARFLDAHPAGTVAVLTYPPAGISERPPRDILEAALAWTLEQTQALAHGLCPRCAGTVERSRSICETHDASAGICGECHARFGLLVDYACTNCTHTERNFPMGLHLLLSAPELLAFVGAKGVNPIMPPWESHAEVSWFDEELRNQDPFEARFTYTLAGDALQLTIDEELDVVSAEQYTPR